MATPIREQTIAAFAALIDAALSADVERNRTKPIPETKDSFVVVLDGPQTRSIDVTNRSDYRMTVTVEGYSRAATSQAAATASNTLYADVVTAALSDYTLGGLSVDVIERDITDVSQADPATKPTCAFSLDFEILYQTVYGDPYTVGP